MTKKDKVKETYPQWVCADCGLKYMEKSNSLKNKPYQGPIIATFHHGTCEVCKQEKAVTEPRDFGYPTFEN